MSTEDTHSHNFIIKHERGPLSHFIMFVYNQGQHRCSVSADEVLTQSGDDQQLPPESFSEL